MSTAIDRILAAGGTVEPADLDSIRLTPQEAKRLEACARQMDRTIARLSEAPAPRRAQAPRVSPDEETVH